MQSAFQFPSQSSLLQLSWQTHKTQSHSTLPNPRINKTSINFSCGYEFKEIGGGEAAPNTVVRLPVVVRRAGKVSRYVWEGGRLRLVCFNREPSDCFGVNDGFRRLYGIWGSAIRELFVPLQVQGNYMVYLKWKLVHRLFSSALHVLATQAMFRAIGIGSAQSLPSAAALNWVLKDGLGRLSRCIYTASLGSAFDTNLKKVRFSTSVLYSMSIGVELLTPVFPQYFLLLATIANIAKSISLAAYLATGSAIHRSFAIADNLGEVSAKAQIQTVCFDNLGLMVAALLNILCNNSERLQAGLPLVVYPIFSAVDLFAIYQGLKHVHLQTLTKDRLEIIVETWIHLGFVPSPAEVSNKEGIGFLRIKGSKMWPIRIGCVDPKDPSSKFSMLTMQSLRGEDFYFLCMETSYRELTRKQQQGILLCLREQAGTADIVMGLLQACYIRKVLLPCRTKWDCILEDDNTADSFLGEWFKVVEDGKTYTQGQIKLLSEEIQKTGWAFKNILLNRREQIRYSLVDD